MLRAAWCAFAVVINLYGFAMTILHMKTVNSAKRTGKVLCSIQDSEVGITDKTRKHMAEANLPEWVPIAARHYLAHTESGQPIRALARAAKVHASTVSRQVRRYETLRDDPLIDAALKDLAVAVAAKHRTQIKDAKMTTDTPSSHTVELKAEQIKREGARVLRQLCETGAVLAVAQGMDRAVVVCDDPSGKTTRTAVVDQNIAQVLALKDWISCDNPEGRICRYRITAQGRGALREIIAASENRAHGFTAGQIQFPGEDPITIPGRRLSTPEGPLAALSRRCGRDGRPFLSRDLVEAAGRLRQDFELAQMGPKVAQDWDQFLTAGIDTTRRTDTMGGPQAAKERVAAALADLGPGLGDVVLHCCCYQEGMETTEKRMGWSARSGKVVLRIALQRLKLHYDETGQVGDMIG